MHSGVAAAAGVKTMQLSIRSVKSLPGCGIEMYTLRDDLFRIALKGAAKHSSESLTNVIRYARVYCGILCVAEFLRIIRVGEWCTFANTSTGTTRGLRQDGRSVVILYLHEYNVSHFSCFLSALYSLNVSCTTFETILRMQRKMSLFLLICFIVLNAQVLVRSPKLSWCLGVRTPESTGDGVGKVHGSCNRTVKVLRTEDLSSRCSTCSSQALELYYYEKGGRFPHVMFHKGTSTSHCLL